MPITEAEAQSILDNLNIPQEDWINPKIEVRKSSLGGNGMFAKEKIEEGEIVVIWGGTAQNVFIEEEIKHSKARKSSSIALEDGIYLAGNPDVEEDSDFLNHSCDSNLWMIDAIRLTARRNIGEGEELTVDYALFQTGAYVSEWECGCGAVDCRKRITGQDWKIPEVQKRYNGHFSPFLNRKIERQKG